MVPPWLEVDREDEGKRLSEAFPICAPFETDERNRSGHHPESVIQDCLRGSGHYGPTWPLKSHGSFGCYALPLSPDSVSISFLLFVPNQVPFHSLPLFSPVVAFLWLIWKHWTDFLFVTSCPVKFICLSLRLNWHDTLSVFTRFPFFVQWIHISSLSISWLIPSHQAFIEPLSCFGMPISV